MKKFFYLIFLSSVFLSSASILFSISSYTITTDIQFNNFETTNVTVIGSQEEAILLLNNHFEKIYPTSIPPKRHSYAMDYSSITKKLFLFGGVNTESYPFIYYNDCWVFDETTNNWTQIYVSSTNLPQARYGHCMVNIGEDKFLLFGGLGQEGQYFNDTFIFSLSSQTFQLINTSTAPPARYYHAMCFVPDENKVYLFGGYNPSGASNDLWFFDITNQNWSLAEVFSSSPSARLGHKMEYIISQNRIYIFGGEESLNYNQKDDLWYYDLVSKNFIQITKTLTWPDAMSHFGMCTYPEFNQILIFAGYKGGSSYSNDLWYYNYISTTFVKCNYYSKGTPPDTRNKFNFIKLKDKFFCFGGTNGSSSFNDNYVYFYANQGIAKDYYISMTNIPTKIVYTTLIFSPSPPPDYTDVKLQVAYSTDGVNYSNYLGPDGTSNSYFTYTQQTFPEIFNNKRYLKLKCELYSYKLPINPYISDIIINYNLTPYPPKLGIVGNITSPKDASIIRTSTNTVKPTFNWYESSDPDGDSISLYKLQISTTPDFSMLSFEITTSDTYYTFITDGIPTGVYHWRVSAKDIHEGDFSEYYTIEIDTTPPTPPTYIFAQAHPYLDKTIKVKISVTGDDASTGTFRGAVVIAYSSYTIVDENNFDSLQKVVFNLRDSAGNYISYPPNSILEFDLTGLQNNTTYFIAAKLQDEALNLSTCSVCISTITNFIPWVEIKHPSNNQQITGNKVNICWDYGDFNTDETSHTFVIYILHEPDRSTVTVKSGIVNTTYYIWNSLEVKNDTYTIKIQIKDTRQAESYDEVNNLYVKNENFPPKIITWIKPQENEVLVGEVKLQWILDDPNLADEHFYEIFITTDFVTKHKIAEFYNSTEFLFNTSLLPNDTNYYLILKVTDEGGLFDISTSPVFSIKNNNLPPSKPVLLLPKHLSFTSPYKVKFSWAASTDPNPNDKVFYDFYLSTDNFVNPLLKIQNLQQTSVEVSYPTIDEEKRYYWKVIAKDIFNMETPSDIFMFFTYPRYKYINEENTIYAEFLEIPQEKIFIHISKICDKENRSKHPLISSADNKDKTDRFLKLVPYDVYEVSFYDENFNKIDKNYKYKLIFYFDETQFDIPKNLLRIAYLNTTNSTWEFTEYKQQVVSDSSLSTTYKTAVITSADKPIIFTLVAKTPVSEPVTNIIVYPNPFNPNIEQVTIEYVLTKDVELKVYILTLSGGLVKEIKFDKGQYGKTKGSPEGQRNSFNWDGKNDKGNLVANGMYICKLVFDNKIVYKYIAVVKK